MLAHKHITKIVAVVMAAAVCLCLCAVAFSGPLAAWAGDKGIAQEYETALFDTSSILSVNIQMDEADWNDMLENATAETYYQCNVEINGTMFYQVGIRPKGNTSLSAIANDDTTDRYSFKLEFDHYVDGQTCFGLDKLILNNNYADATNLKEALIYDMYQYLGADASLYNYAKISLNGEYWGVYLALEGVEDSFQLRNYGTESGELYKPESMDMGGGKAQERPDGMPEGTEKDFANGGPPDAPNQTDAAENAEPGQRPEGDAEQPGGMDRNSGGADLNYTDDDLDSYETIWDGEVTKTNQADHERVVKALKNIAEGNDLESYMDIDNLLRYLAVHVFSVNEDSLSGMMAHNYYLYESDGKLNLIPWDYNLALGGMGGMMAAEILKQRGHNPVIFEASDKLGGQFLLAGLAPMKHEMTEAAQWEAKEVERLGIDVRLNTKVTAETIAAEKPDEVIIAIGSDYVAPAIKGVDGEHVYTQYQVLRGEANPTGNVCVVGCGSVGSELAELLADRGCKVTCLEKKKVGNDLTMLRSMFFRPECQKYGITAQGFCNVTEIDGHTVKYSQTVVNRQTKERTVTEKTAEFDSVVICTGITARPSDDLKAECEKLGVPAHVIGDAKQARTALWATREAYEVAMEI